MMMGIMKVCGKDETDLSKDRPSGEIRCDKHEARSKDCVLPEEL
jgi:hypothetical protein